MESLDYWRKCEQLSVVQAAQLIVGMDPTPKPNAPSWRDETPDSYHAIFANLRGAILFGKLRATIRSDPRHGVLAVPPDARAELQEGGIQHLYRVVPDWHGTLIEVRDLRDWLVERGIESEFFLRDGLPAANYLDRKGRWFSVRLFAAVKAWEAMRDNPSLVDGRSPKQALVKWLRENARKLGLTGNDGTASAKVISDIATVANWNIEGGLPKTAAISSKMKRT
jgi:hypothetical protein